MKTNQINRISEIIKRISENIGNNIKEIIKGVSKKQISRISKIINGVSENIREYQMYLFRIISIFSFLEFYIK